MLLNGAMMIRLAINILKTILLLSWSEKCNIQLLQNAVMAELLEWHLFNKIWISMNTFRSALLFFMLLQRLFSPLDRNSHHGKWHIFHTLFSECLSSQGILSAATHKEWGGVWFFVSQSGMSGRWRSLKCRTQFFQTASGIDRCLLQGTHDCACAGTYTENPFHSGTCAATDHTLILVHMHIQTWCRDLQMKDNMSDMFGQLVTNTMDPSRRPGSVRQDVWPLGHCSAQKRKLKLTFQPD